MLRRRKRVRTLYTLRKESYFPLSFSDDVSNRPEFLYKRSCKNQAFKITQMCCGNRYKVGTVSYHQRQTKVNSVLESVGRKPTLSILNEIMDTVNKQRTLSNNTLYKPFTLRKRTRSSYSKYDREWLNNRRNDIRREKKLQNQKRFLTSNIFKTT